MITPPVPRVGELEFFWNGAGIHLFVRVYLLFVYLFVFTHCSYIRLLFVCLATVHDTNSASAGTPAPNRA